MMMIPLKKIRIIMMDMVMDLKKNNLTINKNKLKQDHNIIKMSLLAKEEWPVGLMKVTINTIFPKNQTI